MKLLLGYSISLPLTINKNNPDYVVEDTQLIHKLSSQFSCIQIMFSKSIITKDDIKTIKYIIQHYKYIYIHASYQINIGSDMLPSQTDLYSAGLDILLNEIIYGNKIGMKGIILHVGKNVKKQFDPDFVYNNMVKFIIELFNKLKNKKIKINLLLETSAGQGGEMLYKLDELVEFIQRFKDQFFYDQLGVCIDTCHIFQASYDLNDNKVIKKIHKIFEPIKDKIGLIHLNDSFNPCGKHIDRHAQIGKGFIKIDQLIKFIIKYKNVPMILETSPPYDKQIKLLS
jgi:deoxyribonuclease-4